MESQIIEIRGSIPDVSRSNANLINVDPEFLCSYRVRGSKDLIQKRLTSHRVKKHPGFYGSITFIPGFTTACHLYLPCAQWIQTSPSQPISAQTTLILFPHLQKHLQNSVDKKNELDVTCCILYFSSNSCSTCFGQPCAHHQELTTAWCYSLVLVCAVAAGRWSSPVGR